MAGADTMNRYETPLPERIKYGLGDFAQNGVFTFMSSYFLFFCTDIAGIGLEYAGMVTFIGRIYYKNDTRQRTVAAKS